MDRLNAKELVLPLIPLRELVAFPTVIVPILVGRDKSVNALKAARQPSTAATSSWPRRRTRSPKRPSSEEMYEIGTIAKIEKSAEQNNGSYRIVIQGLKRGRILQYVDGRDFHLVRLEILEDRVEPGKDLLELSRNLIALFEEYINLKRVAPARHHDPAQAQSSSPTPPTSSSPSSTCP